jgi:hypothetical protein
MSARRVSLTGRALPAGGLVVAGALAILVGFGTEEASVAGPADPPKALPRDVPRRPGAGAFAGRTGAARQRMLREGGGNALSEAAVARGLEWLALHPAADGHWSLHEFPRHARDKPLPDGKAFTCNCTGAATRRNDVAATAFGLLPFLGAGAG